MRRPHPGVRRTRSPRKRWGHSRQGTCLRAGQPAGPRVRLATTRLQSDALAVCEPQTRTGLPCRASLGANASVLLGAMAQGSSRRPLPCCPPPHTASSLPGAPLHPASPGFPSPAGPGWRLEPRSRAPLTPNSTALPGPQPQSASQPASQSGQSVQSASQFSHSVVSNSLRPHGLQHARPPCPSPTPRASSNSCPSSR